MTDTDRSDRGLMSEQPGLNVLREGMERARAARRDRLAADLQRHDDRLSGRDTAGVLARALAHELEALRGTT